MFILKKFCKSCLSSEGNRSPPKIFSGELRDSASSVQLPEDHNDSTNAIRSFRCAAVKALKLFLAVVA